MPSRLSMTRERRKRMKPEDIKVGQAVIIRSQAIGGEVVETGRSDGRFLIKVARMDITPNGVATKIENVLADASDLEPITKKHGVVII